MQISYNNLKVFLTGGSRGIGKNIKETFEKMGGCVISPTHDELDLLSSASIESYIKKSTLDFDIFVHCAGLNLLAGINEITEEIYTDVFKVNCFAPLMLLKSITQNMKDKQYGKIVFISSLYASVSRERRIAYSASKNALNGIMKSLSLELAPYNIMVNSVAPGYVMTDMTRKNLSDKDIIEIEKNIPTGRFQDEEEISDIVAFLCSQYNKSITGQLISVDGGFLCR